MNATIARTVTARAALCLTAIGVGLGVGGCMTAARQSPPPAAEAETRPDPTPVRRSPYSNRFARAYYHYSVAQIEAQQGRFPDAIKELREAIKQDPGTASLWVQLSQWLVRAGDLPAAVEAAEKAIALDPTSGAARLGLADLLRRQKRPADAERELQQAITLNPKAQDGYLALAQHYLPQIVREKLGARAALGELRERHREHDLEELFFRLISEHDERGGASARALRTSGRQP